MKQRQILRRGLSVLLSLLLCLILLPMTVPAATPGETADFTGGDGSAALALLNAAKTAGAEDSTWENNILTLNGVDFTADADIAVILPAGATIELVGDNTITNAGSSTDVGFNYGIFVEGNLTIGGSGTLTVTGGTATYSDGIYVSSYYNGDSRVDGILTITGGTVTAMGGAAKYSYGVYTDGGIIITGGTFEAIGNTTDNGSSLGIDTNKNVVVSGGTVTAMGGAAMNNSIGIRTSSGGSLTITGGTVTAIGGTANQYSFGIDSTATISGGHVIARTLAQTAGFAAALSSKPDLSKYTGYQWCIIPNGEFISSVDTAYTYDESHTYVEFSEGNAVIYTITFDANGGSGSMDTVTVVSGGYTLPANGFTAPKGKQFKGWATGAGGTVITGTVITVTGNTTLYAVWEDIHAEPACAVEINETNFPDANFRSYVSANFDTDSDGALSSREIAAVTRIDCRYNRISDLTGIEHFTALTYLDCSHNCLASLDISGNTALKNLNADDNTYPVRLSEGRTFDLSTLPGGFDPGKASNWSGGTVNGTALTVNDSATEFTYSYDCGNGHSVTFTLEVTKGYTGSAAIPMVICGVAILALAALTVLFVMKKRQSRKG